MGLTWSNYATGNAVCVFDFCGAPEATASGQRILTKGRIACRAALTTEWSLLLRTPPQILPMLFNESDKPKNCPFPVENLDSIWQWFIGPQSTLRTASRSVHRFLQGSRTWPTDRQTDTHTHTHTRIHRQIRLHSNRPHRGAGTSWILGVRQSSQNYWIYIAVWDKFKPTC